MARFGLLNEFRGLREYLSQKDVGDERTSKKFARQIVNNPWFEEHVRRELDGLGITHPEALNRAKERAVALLVPDLTDAQAKYFKSFAVNAREMAIRSVRDAVKQGQIPAKTPEAVWHDELWNVLEKEHPDAHAAFSGGALG